MSSRSHLGFAALLLVALLIAPGLVARRQETIRLRAELTLAQQATNDLAQLRTENRRLVDAQIPVAELERLRADHVALPRLRAEFEALKQTRPQ